VSSLTLQVQGDDDDDDDGGGGGDGKRDRIQFYITHTHLFSRHAWYEDGRLLLVLVTLCVVLPLSMLPKIGTYGDEVASGFAAAAALKCRLL